MTEKSNPNLPVTAAENLEWWNKRFEGLTEYERLTVIQEDLNWSSEHTKPEILQGSSLDRAMADLVAFHVAGDVSVLEFPTLPDKPTLERRTRLVRDEYEEFQDALHGKDLADIVQEGCDLIYVVLGTFLELGLITAAQKAWPMLQESNMAKCDPATGKIVKREDGKILKPEGWKKPDFHDCL